jgi:F-type H+-transporting ATPase subunit beta
LQNHGGLSVFAGVGKEHVKNLLREMLESGIIKYGDEFMHPWKVEDGI